MILLQWISCGKQMLSMNWRSLSKNAASVNMFSVHYISNKSEDFLSRGSVFQSGSPYGKAVDVDKDTTKQISKTTLYKWSHLFKNYINLLSNSREASLLEIVLWIQNAFQVLLIFIHIDIQNVHLQIFHIMRKDKTTLLVYLRTVLRF